MTQDFADAAAETNRRLLELAQTYGTPTYVYDLDRVSAQVDALRGALPGADLHYAVKANPCGAVLRHLAKQGLGAEVITLGELERALRAGFPPERILLGGPKQDAALRSRAVQAGVKLVSLDSVSQWRGWEQAFQGQEVNVRFLVRLNPALDPCTHEHLATGAAESKFGMTLGEAQEVAEALGDKLSGFHVHAGSQIAEMSVYDEIFSTLRPLYERFRGADTLDLGGGFVVPNFPLTRFAEKVSSLEDLDVKLILEPGRYLVAQSGVLLTQVLHVKEGARRHIIADAGMADLLRPALYGAAHPIRVLTSDGDVGMNEVDVDGPLCENADRLGRGVRLPEVKSGDLLAVREAGAYGFTMASNYASSLRPAEVVVQSGEARLARRREEVEDLWRLECD